MAQASEGESYKGERGSRGCFEPLPVVLSYAKAFNLGADILE